MLDVAFREWQVIQARKVFLGDRPLAHSQAGINREGKGPQKGASLMEQGCGKGRKNQSLGMLWEEGVMGQRTTEAKAGRKRDGKSSRSESQGSSTENPAEKMGARLHSSLPGHDVAPAFRVNLGAETEQRRWWWDCCAYGWHCGCRGW